MNKTKRAIFEAAIKVFSLNGYSRATMDDIAFSAGVAKGTLYYHFKSKEEIFNYIIKEGIKIIKDEYETVALDEDDPINKLRILSKVQFSMLYDNRDFFKVIMSQLWGQESRQIALRKVIEGYIGYIEMYIKEAMNKGIIQKGDSKLMAYSFFGALCSAAVYELINEEKNNGEKVINDLMNYIMNGVQLKEGYIY